MADRSGERIEKFKLIKILGEGGMGAVYLAQHTTTDRMVALKLLHESFANNEEILHRIRREAKAAALIGHPNIVEIVDSGTDEHGIPYIAMELLQGESLDALLERTGPMPIPLAAYIICSILDTLGAAHAKGVVHRDMKPENVYLHRQHNSNVPQIKILDFGISKFQNNEQSNLSLTKTGTVMGTPYYMSVEQAMGQKVDGRTDIYSVGVMLYQLLTNQLPFFDSNYNRVLIQIVTGQVPPIDQIRPDLPPELVAIVNRAMARDLNDRYPDCHSFMVELQSFWSLYEPSEIFDSISAGAKPAPTHPLPFASTPAAQTFPVGTSPGSIPSVTRITAASGQSEESPKSRKWIAVLAAGMLILAGVGVFIWLSGKKDSQMTTPVTASANSGNSTASMEPPPETPMEPEMAVQPPPETPMEPEMAIQPPPETPMETPLPATITVDVSGVPRNAIILIDGKKIRLPASFPGSRGMHSLVVTAPGYEPFIRNIEYTQDITVQFDAPKASGKSGMKPNPASSEPAMPPENMTESPMKDPMNVDFNTPDF